MLPAPGDAGVAEAWCVGLPAVFPGSWSTRIWPVDTCSLSQELRRRRCLVLQLPLEPFNSCIADMLSTRIVSLSVSPAISWITPSTLFSSSAPSTASTSSLSAIDRVTSASAWNYASRLVFPCRSEITPQLWAFPQTIQCFVYEPNFITFAQAHVDGYFGGHNSHGLTLRARTLAECRWCLPPMASQRRTPGSHGEWLRLHLQRTNHLSRQRVGNYRKLQTLSFDGNPCRLALP